MMQQKSRHGSWVKGAAGTSPELAGIARRIVSVVPSQTELLHDLGLDEEVVGVTKFCVHPPGWRRSRTVVGGTKQLKTELILRLQPDLVLGNLEENTRADLEALASRIPVWISDVRNLEDALDMILAVGQLTGRQRPAATLAGEIALDFERLPPATSPGTALYLIWNDPVMAAGSDTFIDDMVRRCGFRNVLAGQPRYPVLAQEALFSLQPDVVLLSSEPFPFRPRHAERFRNIFPSARILPVDGELFSWYGSRLKHTPAYFRSLAHQIQSGF
jgi:ABC-type hemin transport system substrate-binding protein